MDESLLPLTVYGSNISYFTGKLETYLRLKGIPYKFEAMHGRYVMPMIERETGTTQMPAVLLADGRWLTDTTPMIAWLETRYPTPPIVPRDPLQRFFCLLLEDYADEWLWRPAMHYRWYSEEGAQLQSRHLADELTEGLPLPGFLRRWLLRNRQRLGYTFGDGIRASNRHAVEAVYLNNLDWLNSALSDHPFLLGDSPCLADVAFMGPFLRHFSQDPVAAEIMKQRAAPVWSWVARTWACTPQQVSGDWLGGIPHHWGPWLKDIATVYLPYLNANADACKRGKKRFSPCIDGVTYPNAKASQYRVWCLEQLRERFGEMPETAQADARSLLESHNCWQPLWQAADLDSGVNVDCTPPFGGSHKMVG